MRRDVWGMTTKNDFEMLFADEFQIDGDHYVKLKIQPFKYCRDNGFNVTQSNIIKYASRMYDHPDGVRSMLEKIKHYCDLELQYIRENECQDQTVKNVKKDQQM